MCIALAITVSACHSKNDSQPTDPVVATPTLMPPVPTATPVPVVADHCSPVGKQFQCGNPVWFNLPKCGPGNEDGTVYFENSAAAKQANAVNGASKSGINGIMKDGSELKIDSGFGPFIPCIEL